MPTNPIQQYVSSGLMAMVFRTPLALRTRFILSSTALISLLMAIVVFFVERAQTDFIGQQAQEHGAALARAVADLSVNALTNNDVLALQQNMERTAGDQDTLYALIFNNKGQLLAANEEARRLLPASVLRIEDLSRIGPERVLFREVTHPATEERPTLNVLEVVVPVLVGEEDDPFGAVKLGLSMDRLNAAMRQTRLGLISLGFFGLTLGTLGSMLLARSITRPLETLVEGTIKVSEGDLKHCIAIPPGDEIGELASKFNRMTAQILEDRQQIEDTSKKLIQAEKLATIGRLSAAVAHEIRNPLTSIKLNIQKVSKSPCLAPPEAEQLDIAERGIRQVEQIVKEILDYARSPKLTKDQFSLTYLLDDALRFAQEPLEERRVAVVREYYPSLPLMRVDGDKLRQVFLNIILNAVEAVPIGGRVTARSAYRVEGEKAFAVIEVEDNGSGIAAADMNAIFEPFFTTKSLGTGLGLANARKVIELHQGAVKVQSGKNVGTVITVTLPYETATEAPAEEVKTDLHEVHSGH